MRPATKFRRIGGRAAGPSLAAQFAVVHRVRDTLLDEAPMTQRSPMPPRSGVPGVDPGATIVGGTFAGILEDAERPPVWHAVPQGTTLVDAQERAPDPAFDAYAPDAHAGPRPQSPTLSAFLVRDRPSAPPARSSWPPAPVSQPPPAQRSRVASALLSGVLAVAGFTGVLGQTALEVAIAAPRSATPTAARPQRQADTTTSPGRPSFKTASPPRKSPPADRAAGL